LFQASSVQRGKQKAVIVAKKKKEKLEFMALENKLQADR